MHTHIHNVRHLWQKDCDRFRKGSVREMRQTRRTCLPCCNLRMPGPLASFPDVGFVLLPASQCMTKKCRTVYTPCMEHMRLMRSAQARIHSAGQASCCQAIAGVLIHDGATLTKEDRTSPKLEDMREAPLGLAWSTSRL